MIAITIGFQGCWARCHSDDTNGQRWASARWWRRRIDKDGEVWWITSYHCYGFMLYCTLDVQETHSIALVNQCIKHARNYCHVLSSEDSGPTSPTEQLTSASFRESQRQLPAEASLPSTQLDMLRVSLLRSSRIAQGAIGPVLRAQWLPATRQSFAVGSQVL